MSTGKAQSYRKPDATRSLRLPYFADKLRQILEYFSFTEKDIHERTGASQQSVSDWRQGNTCPRESTLRTLATQLPEPIPLWWLTSGPEGGSLEEALAKEKAQTPQLPSEEEADPEPTGVRYERILKKIYAKSEKGDPDAEELKQIMERQLILADKILSRQQIDAN